MRPKARLGADRASVFGAPTVSGRMTVSLAQADPVTDGLICTLVVEPKSRA